MGDAMLGTERDTMLGRMEDAGSETRSGGARDSWETEMLEQRHRFERLFARNGQHDRICGFLSGAATGGGSSALLTSNPQKRPETSGTFDRMVAT